jgi:hypothetical protein
MNKEERDRLIVEQRLLHDNAPSRPQRDPFGLKIMVADYEQSCPACGDRIIPGLDHIVSWLGTTWRHLMCASCPRCPGWLNNDKVCLACGTQSLDDVIAEMVNTAPRTWWDVTVTATISRHGMQHLRDAVADEKSEAWAEEKSEAWWPDCRLMSVTESHFATETLTSVQLHIQIAHDGSRLSLNNAVIFAVGRFLGNEYNGPRLVSVACDFGGVTVTDAVQLSEPPPWSRSHSKEVEEQS